MNMSPVTLTQSILRVLPHQNPKIRTWEGPIDSIAFDEDRIRNNLLNMAEPVYVVRYQDQIGITQEGELSESKYEDGGIESLIVEPAISLDQFGDAGFCSWYGTQYAYYGGAMANGIASEEMVIALGKSGFLGSFGAAGCGLGRIEAAIQRMQAALPNGPFAFNLIHHPSDEAMERRVIDLYMKYGVTTVEASAFLDLSPSIVYYRVAGLSQDTDGGIKINNRIISKVSRKEIATKFMQPAPTAIINQLLEENLITEKQANLALKIPMTDDITVEADSGGHTDNRPLVCLIPTMLALRDELQAKYNYATPIRIGAAGGISTPSSALGAYMMGAAYIGTGSVNQACIEAGTSEHTKNLLSQLDMADVTMAPSADMFEMGVKVQVVKKGTLFAMRAQKLFDLYTKYNSLEDIPSEEKDKLERQIFKRDIASIWQETVKFFTERDVEQIVRANENPKRKMALVFRWYLGLASRWSCSGEKGREMDYQIWCGPSIGTFNDWTRGTYLADPHSRRVVDVASHILTGCAYLYRLENLKMQGLQIPSVLWQYRPSKPIS